MMKSKIMRTGDINVVDDVMVIEDLGPSPAPPRPKKPAPKAAVKKEAAEGAEEGALDDTAEIIGDAEEADDFSEDFEPEENVEHKTAVHKSSASGISPSGMDIKEEILQTAMAEAGRILEEAVRNGEEQKRQMLEDVQAEAEQLRIQAAQQGREDGRQEVLGEVQRTASEIEQGIAKFEGEKAGFESEIEEQLKWMSVEIAEKVLAHKVAENDAVLADMVNKAVQSVKSEPWVRVEVAQEMVRLVDALTVMYEQQDNIEVSAIPANPGTIQIETPSGVVDASLHTQLENLKAYFASVG